MFQRFYVIAVLLVVIMVSGATAQDDPVAEYAGGVLTFDYDALWGSYGGNFFAEGVAFPESGEFPAGQTETCGGGFSTSNDTTTVIAYGAVLNEDDTVDFSLIAIREPGDLISTGNHPIDVETYMCLALYFDNVSDFTPPDDTSSIEEWLNAVVADYKFISTSGSISVSSCDEFGFEGSFDITMIDPDSYTIISADQASFNFYLLVHPVAVSDVTNVLSSISAAPNPFNPMTNINFELANDSMVSVDIYNPAGELVSNLWSGDCLIGLNSFTWNGCADDGSKLSSGVYLYKITADNQVVSGKIMLAK